ncbi:uncharacterized protein LOC109843825 [Asparagus officinalis]|uniref:uncharacterized protein LOC109843825 n=1 Tax=Asparagus officinalis TaxID=4686 RepID=UPI00098E6F51|nr:uncharacterized protein LOC109843825 [Asparagus officinalis]
MESSNDNVDNQKNKGTDDAEGKTFNWTNDFMIVLLELCLAFVAKNGRNQLFKWRDIAKDFEARTNRKVNNYKSLKNKYDQMKRDWRIWKGLKQSETGLGWDCITGKLDCSNEWWEIKIKKKP